MDASGAAATSLLDVEAIVAQSIHRMDASGSLSEEAVEAAKEALRQELAPGPAPVDDANYAVGHWTDPVVDSTARYSRIRVLVHNEEGSGFARRFFVFDDDFAPRLVIVVFETRAGTMASVNESVMSLDSFLTVTSVTASAAAQTKPEAPPNLQLRLSPVVGAAPVVCRTREGERFEIANTTVPAIMMALARLSAEYPEARTQTARTQAQEAAVAALVEAFVHA